MTNGTKKNSFLVKVIMSMEYEECISKKRFLFKRDIFGLISVAFFSFPSHMLAFIYGNPKLSLTQVHLILSFGLIPDRRNT